MNLRILKNNPILFIFILSFSLRFIYGVYSYNNDIVSTFNDDKLYSEISNEIIDKGLFNYQENHGLDFAIISPGFPIILSLEKLIYDSWIFIFIINSIISSLVVLLIYKTTILFFKKNIGILAALFAAIYVPYLKYIPTAGKEIWIHFIFISVCYFFLKYIYYKKYNLKAVLFIAFLFSILIYIDERYLAYIPIILLSLLFISDNSKYKLKALFLFSIAVLFLLSPWVYRNNIVFGEPLILTPRTASITSKIFFYQTKYDNIIKDFTSGRYYLSSEKIDSIKSGHPNLVDNNGRKISSQQYDAIINYNKIPYKFSFFENVIMNLRTMWKPIDINYNYTTGGYRFDGKWSLKHNLSVGLTYGLLFFFSINGFYNLYKCNKKLFYIFISIIIYHTIIHIFFIPFTRFRYRIPLDFIIIIFGSFGIYSYYIKLLNKRTKRIFN